jgi:hypothetical protein
MSPDTHSLGATFRHLFIAGVTASFAGLAVADLIDSEGLRFAAAGSTGYAGVALWDLAAEKIRGILERFGK